MGAGSLTRQGEAAMADAEKELAKWTMFDSTGKNERASDLYQRAANAFKGARDCEEQRHEAASRHSTQYLYYLSTLQGKGLLCAINTQEISR